MPFQTTVICLDYLEVTTLSTPGSLIRYVLHAIL